MFLSSIKSEIYFQHIQLCNTGTIKAPWLLYLSGWAGHWGCKPVVWTENTERVSSSPRGFPKPAAGGAATAPC